MTALGYDLRTLSPAICPRHPARSTRFICDGCGEQLCEECVDEGHRLLFCTLCGERALPLAGVGPATSSDLAADRKRLAAYSWLDAFGYVFRGTGAQVFWSFPALVVILSLLGMFPLLGIVAGCFKLVFAGIILVILPGALFAVVRETARGEVELPDWPDFHSYGARLNEIFEFLLISMVASIPGALLLRALGCGNESTFSIDCWYFVGIAWLVAALIWVPSFGAVAAYGNFWLALRADLHLKAIRETIGDFALVMTLATLLMLVGQSLAIVLLGIVPVLGMAVSAIVGLYSWFTIAHLVGLWFRRHGRLFEQIYRGA